MHERVRSCRYSNFSQDTQCHQEGEEKEESPAYQSPRRDRETSGTIYDGRTKHVTYAKHDSYSDEEDHDDSLLAGKTSKFHQMHQERI